MERREKKIEGKEKEKNSQERIIIERRKKNSQAAGFDDILYQCIHKMIYIDIYS